MPENNQNKNYHYGKSVFKTIFFSIASATTGAVCALPSLSFETIINASLESGYAGLLIGSTMMAALAIMQQEPHVNLKVIIPALASSVILAQNYLAYDDNVAASLTL